MIPDKVGELTSTEHPSRGALDDLIIFLKDKLKINPDDQDLQRQLKIAIALKEPLEKR